MGTRADFYVGIGKEAEWLGSIAYDGFPNKWGHPGVLLRLKTENTYRKRVKSIIEKNLHSGAVFPENGWPWPWEDSSLTDYSYYFYNDRVYYTDIAYPEDGDEVQIEYENIKRKFVPYLPNGKGQVGSGLHKYPKNVNTAGFMLLGVMKP